MHKTWGWSLTALLLASCAGAPADYEGQGGDAGFTAFYERFKDSLSSRQAGIFEAAFHGRVAPYRVAQTAAKNQPELKKSFEEYVGPMLKAERVSVARERLNENREVLDKIVQKTGVPAEVIVALWGIETSFGRVQGQHPVIPALATLAWQSHRQEFYTKELRAALELIDDNDLGPDVKGSWAGAVGQPQFMPSTYLKAGVDGDGDGRIDLFNDLPDVFASTANLLKQNGWKRGLPWRIALPEGAKIPRNLKLNERGLSEPFVPAGLDMAGVADGEKYRYYKPLDNAPGFLLGPNFDAVLRWNNSSYFAYAVLTLADMLKGESE